MQLTQDKFDQIVNALVDQLDAKHSHVQTVTSGGPATPFHIGYSVMADALQVTLEAHGVKVVGDDEATATVDAAKALSLCDSVIHGTAASAGLIREKASALRNEAEAAMLATIA